MGSKTKALKRSDPQKKSRVTTPRLPRELERFTARFDAPARREIRRLMRQSSRLSDLAAVFPGAIYSLATRRGSADMRDEAIALIEQGAVLKTVARRLDLPMWLRKLPPEAFRGDLPALPRSDSFSRRIASRLPASPAESALWLESVSFAAQAAHEDFAVWVAEQAVFSEDGDARELFAVIAAYAWFSGQVLTWAHKLIVVPWRPEIAFDTALCAAKSWFNRMRLVCQLDEGVITDTWLEPGEANGYLFEPLLAQVEILDEAHAMQNCADQYAERLARDKCRLFSVRHMGSRVATLEIGPHPRETGVLAITQLKSRHNMPASVEVWQAAHAWLSQQSGIKRLPALGSAPERPLDLRAWKRLMEPYRRRVGAHWLPEKPGVQAFRALDVDMAELARRGAVTSWLFT